MQSSITAASQQAEKILDILLSSDLCRAHKDHLSRMIEQDALILFKQDQFDITGTHIVGTEIFARIPDPDNAQIYMPADYWVEAAEQHQLMSAITDHILLKLLTHPTLNNITAPCFVNIPPSLLTTDLVTNIESMCHAYNVSPKLLGLELTERDALNEIATLLPAITRAQQSGIRVALDDFGRGYADIFAVKSLPFDIIKIDKDALKSAQTDQITHNKLIAMKTVAKEKGCTIIAEGIETEQDYAFAQSLACDSIQGHLLSRATPL